MPVMPRNILSSVNENRRFLSVSSHDETEPEPETRCGIGSFRPKLLQKCNNPKVMVIIMCMYVFVQGFVVSGIAKVNVSALERRFQLKSTHMGIVDSAYDFSAAFFGLVVSYLGSGRHKARLLSISALAMMFGTFVMTIPHFTTGLYEWGEHSMRTCDVTDNTTVPAKCIGSGLQNYFWVFIFAMTVLGMGGATLFTVGIAYIDDSVPSTLSPMYLGIFAGCSALGPCIGFIVGGICLGMYVDFDVIDVSGLPFDTNDARWVGAWWIGPVFGVFMYVIPAVGLMCFGAELPSAKVVRETRISQRHGGTSTSPDASTPTRLRIKELPKVTVELFKNPPFLFTTFAAITETMYLAGITTFMAKYVQNVYNMSLRKAGIVSGVIGLLGFTGGITTGGFVCRCLKLKVKGMLKLSLCACAISTAGLTMFYAKCGQTKSAGVNTRLQDSSSISLLDTCNKDCKCSTERYEMSCDQNGVQFLSPCYAGCRGMSEDGTTFYNCSCVEPSAVTNETTLKSGSCEYNCGLFYVFIPLLFLMLFFTMVADVPAEQAALRSIDENHRTIMCGLSRFLGRLLGTVPGSIIMGAATDAGCRIWQRECGEISSCWLYDNDVISRNYFVIGIVTKLFSLVFYYCALRFYRPPKDIDVDLTVEIDGNIRTEVFSNGTEPGVEN